MNVPKKDTISLFGDFLWDTANGLRRFVSEVDGHDGRLDSGTPETWAFLWFQLREAEDRPEWFPRGKWATIQHLEKLLSECAAIEIPKPLL